MSGTYSNPYAPDPFVSSFDTPSYGDQSVTAGDFVFNGWEVPEQVTWGGQQRMTVHKFVGGTRFIDVLGPDNSDVSWSSRFLGPDAYFRADQLDQMRKAGAAIELVFAGRFYIAVISHFVANQVMQFHVPYQITFTILSDNSFVPAPEPTPLQAVSADVIAVSALTLAPPLLPAQVAVAAIQPLLLPMTAIAAGTAATVALSTAVSASAAQIAAAQTLADNQIAAITAAEVTAGNLAGATNVIGAVASMQTALAATYASASAASMAGYVGRASTNIANAA